MGALSDIRHAGCDVVHSPRTDAPQVGGKGRDASIRGNFSVGLVTLWLWRPMGVVLTATSGRGGHKGVDLGINELSTVLWRERELLESLLFKLEEEELVLASGRARWVGRATREVEAVLDQIRGIELGRAVEADDAAREVGLAEGASLQDLAKAAPAPWNDLLRSHHVALTDLTGQIDACAQSNRRNLTQSVHAAHEALMGIHTDASL